MVVAVTARLAVLYGDGWDEAVINRLEPAAARERDRTGEPYTVVLALDGRLHAVLDLAWADGYGLVTRFDPAGRRVARHEFRGTPDGDLFLRRAATWDGPPEAGVHEFPHVAARTAIVWTLAGERNDVVEPRGDRGDRQQSRSAQFPARLPIPPFGRWSPLLALTGDRPGELVDAGRSPLPVESDEVPWQPPRPMRPADVESLFAAGTEIRYQGRRLRRSVEPAGPLRLPSGRLVADDPSSLDIGPVPFQVAVTPGTYPVSVGLVTFADEPRHSRVAAVRVDVGGSPVRWELALREGDDPLDLGHDEFFGFGVDAGLGCFVDADAVDGMKDVWRTLDGLVDPRHRTVGAGSMVAWSSGWGDGAYPTWIGYDAGGGPASFVADMLLFPGDD
jgi:hypothetical protein